MKENYEIKYNSEYRPQAKPTKERERRVIYKGYPLYLPSEDVIEKFKLAYPETENERLTEITHRSKSYNSRLGNYLGLSKSESFKERRQAKLVLKVRQNHDKGKPEKGVCPPWLVETQFGKPNGNRSLTGEEKSKKMKELWKSEKLREKYGLMRKTKLRVK